MKTRVEFGLDLSEAGSVATEARSEYRDGTIWMNFGRGAFVTLEWYEDFGCHPDALVSRGRDLQRGVKTVLDGFRKGVAVGLDDLRSAGRIEAGSNSKMGSVKFSEPFVKGEADGVVVSVEGNFTYDGPRVDDDDDLEVLMSAIFKAVPRGLKFDWSVKWGAWH